MGQQRDWLHVVFKGKRFILVSHLVRTIQYTLYTREATEFQVPKFNLILYSLYVDV